MVKQVTETVDTPAAETVGGVATSVSVWLPDAADLPRESARETAAISGSVLQELHDVAERLAQPVYVEAAADVRRRVAVLADTVAKRKLSRTATRDMLTALRIAERSLGRAMIGIPSPQWREYVPDRAAAFRCSELAAVTQKAFDAAIEAWRRPGGFAGFESLLEIIRGNTPAAEELDTEPVEDHSDVPPEEIHAAITIALNNLAEAARILRRVTPGRIGTLTPEQATDWAGQVWTDAIPVLTLRKNLLERGAH